MAVVTFMSDYGRKDHYVAAVKAAILRADQSTNVIDISHDIKPFDIGHGGYVLANAFKEFPIGTVHLIALETTNNGKERSLAVKLEDHYFVGRDSGIYSIISQNEPEMVVEIESARSTFITRDSLAEVAVKIIKGASLESLGNVVTDHVRLIPRQPKVTKREIVGHIVRVDHYGNLMTNISKIDYDSIQKLNGNVPILIQFGREQFHKFHENYHNVEPGECFVLFNSSQKLQIGLNMGNASELLGLKEDAPVYITFNL